MLGIEHSLPGHLGRRGSAGLADDHRIHPRRAHPFDQRPQERRLAGAVGTLQNDEEPRAHPSVMMLLVAPFSIPSLICWFTLAISFSKLARAAT